MRQPQLNCAKMGGGCTQRELRRLQVGDDHDWWLQVGSMCAISIPPNRWGGDVKGNPDVIHRNGWVRGGCRPVRGSRYCTSGGSVETEILQRFFAFRYCVPRNGSLGVRLNVKKGDTFRKMPLPPEGRGQLGCSFRRQIMTETKARG